MNAASEKRLEDLIPVLASNARELAANMLSKYGEEIEVSQGERSWNEQAAYYAQGREPLEQVNAKRAAVGLAAITEEANQEKVTDAPPGYGYHEYAMAFDAFPVDHAGKPDWNAEHPVWKQMEQEGEAIGMVSGSEFRTFKDNPHFQMSGKFPWTPNDEVRQLFKDGGTDAVWRGSGLYPEQISAT